MHPNLPDRHRIFLSMAGTVPGAASRVVKVAAPGARSRVQAPYHPAAHHLRRGKCAIIEHVCELSNTSDAIFGVIKSGQLSDLAPASVSSQNGSPPHTTPPPSY